MHISLKKAVDRQLVHRCSALYLNQNNHCYVDSTTSDEIDYFIAIADCCSDWLIGEASYRVIQTMISSIFRTQTEYLLFSCGFSSVISNTVSELRLDGIIPYIRKSSLQE